MLLTDTIADMLTRIRNAGQARKSTVDIPASNKLEAIVKILEAEGYIASYERVNEDVQGVLRVTLKYQDGKHIISGLRRISTPGLRIYAGVDELPKVLGGLGIAIVSTPKGVMTDREAREQNVGGEVLCYVW